MLGLLSPPLRRQRSHRLPVLVGGGRQEDGNNNQLLVFNARRAGASGSGTFLGKGKDPSAAKQSRWKGKVAPKTQPQGVRCEELRLPGTS